ncbi:NAD(P)-binding protein [Polychaeton citri CBS 116435]|uniref:NAD(P)-binding protein n=1 Tax=Polychaeton citri CBS 116435 TaxID=1314669 RepID=A0A9P4UQ16_9PEZI|nr:NAD(P)-binding protein [Polychaeton citri CBS 116435]
MSGRLQDRTAIVTGGASGLGREICLALASEGCKILLFDLYQHPRNATNSTTGKADDMENRSTTHQPILQELSALYGKDDRFTFFKGDVTSAQDWQAAVQTCVRWTGRVDILCNNAGISVESTHSKPHGVHELSESDFDRTMAINVKGVYLGCKYVIGQMLQQELLPGVRDRGWIVNTASIQGLVAYHNTPAYTASKGAVVQLTKQVALDYAPHRVHCNSICPGFLRTAMTQNLQNDPAMQAEIDRAHPFGGMGDPKNVARVVVFLCSDDAAWIQGVNLPVDGGYMIM